MDHNVEEHTSSKLEETQNTLHRRNIVKTMINFITNKIVLKDHLKLILRTKASTMAQWISLCTIIIANKLSKRIAALIHSQWTDSLQGMQSILGIMNHSRTNRVHIKNKGKSNLTRCNTQL